MSKLCRRLPSLYRPPGMEGGVRNFATRQPLFTSYLSSTASVRSNRCLLLSKFGVRNEPWLSYRPISSLFPPSGLMPRKAVLLRIQTFHAFPSMRPPSHDYSRVGRSIEEEVTPSLPSHARARLGMWRTGGGPFTIRPLACRRHGHLGPLTTNFILSTSRSRFDAFTCLETI